MQLEDIRTLYKFNYWAKKRIMEVVGTLSTAQFCKDMGSSHGGIRGTLVHSMGAEEIWLVRWKGEVMASVPKEADFPDVASLVARWTIVERDILHFCDSLTLDDDIMRSFDYKDLKGNSHSAILFQAMQHLVNHSTFHRGQVVALLRQAGVKPVATDMIAYYREIQSLQTKGT